ncbi:MAG: hypothetical protein LBH26_07210 [Treponema sp.]|jgi:hypothetical protein|nr:hypothetical protein [Treponema sp.]
MTRYRALIGIIISALGLLVLLALSQFETYSRTRYLPASREVRANPFYALERWLGGAGRPIRWGDGNVFSRNPAAFIRELSGREGIIFLESSLFYWDGAEDPLLSWIREGGALILSLNPPWDGWIDGDFADFLERQGVRAEDGMYLEEEDAETGEPDVPDGEDGGGEGQPLFHWRFRFSPSGELPAGEAAPPIFIKDRAGLGRIARLSLGKGSLTVMGVPLFMYNANLKEAANARLAWELSAAGASAERPEILCIRGGGAVKSLTGRLLERGNLLPPLAAALFLILTGFWMLIPSFGIPRREEPDSGLRSIRERFRAEALFLKRHCSLGVYLEEYVREIEYRGRIGNRDTTELVEPAKAALASGKRLSSPEALRLLESLRKILERL